MSKILESAILREVQGAKNVHIDGECAYVDYGDDRPVVRYLLSPEAQRIALLEREGRPLDIRTGEVDLLVPPTGE